MGHIQRNNQMDILNLCLVIKIVKLVYKEEIFIYLKTMKLVVAMNYMIIILKKINMNASIKVI